MIFDYPQWFALRTRSRHEFTVGKYLRRQNIETFLPTYFKINQWSDRRKTVEYPLFAGYCLAWFSWKDRNIIARTPGLANIVSINGRGVAIPDEEIVGLRRLQESGVPYDPSTYFHKGMTVQVYRGPLAGLTGMLLSRRDDHRLVIGVSLLQQGASLTIDISDVLPLDAEVPSLAPVLV